MFVTKNKLEKHHELTMKKSKAEFTDFPKIEVDELRQMHLKKLECEMIVTYLFYTDRTIEENMREIREVVLVPCCLTSLTAVAGIATGSGIIVAAAVTGGVVGICYSLAVKFSQPKKKLKLS